MKQFPNKVKFTKVHKQKSFKGSKASSLQLYTYGIRLQQTTSLTYNQLEAGRKVLSRFTKPKSSNKKNKKIIASQSKVRKTKKRSRRKIYILTRTTLNLPLTKKPTGIRMGKGRGTVDTYIYPARASRMLLEFSSRKFTIKRINKLSKRYKNKLSSDVKIVYNKRVKRREYFSKKNDMKR